MKRWDITGKFDTAEKSLNGEDLVLFLLKNRQITTPDEINAFLHPLLSSITIDSVGIDKKQLSIALHRIREAIKNKEHIIVFGDYDVDGIAGTAILWETLHALGANVTPYIPHRIDEGYGLSVKGITAITEQYQDIGLIITVDNGIVASDATKFATEKGIKVIITDHHTPSDNKPDAYAIVHTTKLCGTGVAYMLSQELKGTKTENDDHLALVALATIADLVPLLGANRTMTIFGLEELKKTKRPGLLELYKESGINQQLIDVYTIGHQIAPRLNAMGRLEYAMESLRLLCANNQKRAEQLAEKLGSTNKERQQLTMDTVLHAKTTVRNQKTNSKKLLFISDKNYQQGVIGLVAGKLVEEFYRPSIVVSIGDTQSKASARSIHGFNIIEFIRTGASFLVDAGGHPMAAGFTVETSKLSLLQDHLEKLADEMLDAEQLTRVLHIDCELPLAVVNRSFYDCIQQLAPFGMNNPEPVFMSKQVTLDAMRLVGADKKHLKLQVSKGNTYFDAIAFGIGERANEFKTGDTIDIVFTVAEDTWNGNAKLQLKIKDMRLTTQ